MKKKICFIATGGTIASRDMGSGLLPGMDAGQLLAAVPQLGEICRFEWVQLLQLDSSNLQPEHWRQIAEAILARCGIYDGFVISHGTDTMAYTGAALYYMLRNIPKPVVLTGSQLPMDQPGTDAAENLLTAFQAAASGRGGVYLAFGGHVLWGHTAKKLYTRSFRAFYSINGPEAGCVDSRTGQIVWQCREEQAGTLVPRLSLDDRVAVLKLVPGTSPELLRLLTDAGYRGIILEAFGAGGVPSDESSRSLLPMVDYAVSRGVILVCSTQCLYEGVHLESYEVGVRAMEHGVLSGGAATLEALTARLMLALGEAGEAEAAKRIFINQ